MYANQVANHLSVIKIIDFLKKNFTSTPVIVLENSQAVTAYSLSKIKNEFLDIGYKRRSHAGIAQSQVKIDQLEKAREYLSLMRERLSNGLYRFFD